jgi:hypothetical protein
MRFTRVVFLIALAALVAVPTALALRFTDASFLTPVGYTDQPYQHKFDGAAGCGPDPNVPGSGLPYQFRILSGTLPPGLSLAKNGLVSGTPTQAGEYSFWVELSDEDPPSADWCVPKKAEREFKIKILAGLNIQQNSLSPKATFLNKPYSFQLTAEGGGTQTWSLLSGSLPPGINLAANGLLAGTPTVAGDYTFKVKVTDGNRTDSETYTLAVVPELKITQPKSPGAEVGHPFTMTFKATGGRAPYTWSVAADTPLPSGFTLDPATGVISGIPGVVSSAVVKLSVTDALGLSDTVDVDLPVAAKLAIRKKALPAAKVGRNYKGRVPTIGGVGPFKYRVVKGKLPANIRLNSKTGVLSGTPSKAGTSKVTIQVTDKLRKVARATVVLKVNA